MLSPLPCEAEDYRDERGDEVSPSQHDQGLINHHENNKQKKEQASCTRWSRTTEGRGLLRLWPQGKLPAPGNLPRAHRVPVPPDEPSPLVAAAGVPLQSDA